MFSSKCALCDKKITKADDTREHIIPNAIGGRKKIKGFICKSCNNTSGDNWDSELAKQLNPLSLFFGISRDRGDVPSQIFETTGGEKLKLCSDGSMTIEKPIYSETKVDSGQVVKIHITARSIDEAKRMLRGIKRKYPQADIDELLNNVKQVSHYSPDMLEFNLSFGGAEAGRSIVKSALALAVSSGISADICNKAIDYLKNKDAEACFGYFYESDLIKNRPECTPIHCVAIKGCSETKQVIGYVEYFGVQRVVLCLSDSYEGKDISNSYAINPITGQELILDVELNLSNKEIRDAYEYKKIPDGSIGAAFNKVIPTGMQASFERERDRVLNKAVKNAFENCGAIDGETWTHEHINKAVGIIIEDLKPFIHHNFTNYRK